MKELLPEKYSTVLIGPPGVGKLDFCIDLAHYYLKKGEKVIFVTTERSPADIEKRGKGIGADLSKHSNNLYYCDCYSWSLRQTTPPVIHNQNTIRITNPESLNEIIVKVEKVMDIFGGNVRVILHSLSPLFLHSEDRGVIKFLQLITTRVKENGSFLLASIQEGVHSPSTINTLRYLFDGVMEMRFQEGKMLERQIRIHHLKDLSLSSNWGRVTIDKKGFSIQM